jgi:hypothetical protein
MKYVALAGRTTFELFLFLFLFFGTQRSKLYFPAEKEYNATNAIQHGQKRKEKTPPPPAHPNTAIQYPSEP